MHRLENSSYIVVYGGRNDHFFKILSHKLSFVDAFLFNVDLQSWSRVQTGSYRPESRFSFGSDIVGSTLYVLGGLGDNNYLSSKLEKLEFDSTIVEAMIKVEEGRSRSKESMDYNYRDGNKVSMKSIESKGCLDGDEADGKLFN